MSGDTTKERNDALMWRELEATDRDLAQVRSLVSDAVKQLSTGFNEIAERSSAQQVLLVQTLAQITDSPAANESVSGFLSQSEQLVERVADGLERASQQAVQVTEQLSAVDASFSKLVTLSNSVSDVSEQIRVLAFNANLEVARAGDSGRGFAVVALAMRALSQSFQALTAQIRDTVGDARQTLSETVHVAESAAEAERRLAQTTRQEMVTLQTRTSSLNRRVGSSLRKAQQLNEAVHNGVGQCLRGLQFDDLVSQICQAHQSRLTAWLPLLLESYDCDPAKSEAVNGESTSREGLEARLNELQHRVVQQTCLDAGDVEFF